MNIEDQVCSLELAKKLKELGVKQESLFRYIESLTGYHAETKIELIYGYFSGANVIQAYAAFTVAELGEMLPEKIIHDKEDYHLIYTKYKHELNYVNLKCSNFGKISYNKDLISVFDIINNLNESKMVDSFAITLIYLIENNFIKDFTWMTNQ